MQVVKILNHFGGIQPLIDGYLIFLDIPNSAENHNMDAWVKTLKNHDHWKSPMYSIKVLFLKIKDKIWLLIECFLMLLDYGINTFIFTLYGILHIHITNSKNFLSNLKYWSIT